MIISKKKIQMWLQSIKQLNTLYGYFTCAARIYGKNCLKYINTLKKIIICFNDTNPGRHLLSVHNVFFLL